MSTTKYDEDFKKSLVTLYQNGKTQAQLCREYGVSKSALCKWVKQYATVQTDDGVGLRQIEARQQAPDHPILWNVPETDYLKFFILYSLYSLSGFCR